MNRVEKEWLWLIVCFQWNTLFVLNPFARAIAPVTPIPLQSRSTFVIVYIDVKEINDSQWINIQLPDLLRMLLPNLMHPHRQCNYLTNQ